MSENEKLVPVSIEDEMKSAFLDYAMSVIISRALPDVRDGLKPVHRRILTTLHDLNLNPARPYRKCAKISGDVSGNYHPHGEAVIYPSLVRMAQKFSLRYPLVDGQGNFGSVDGDPPAAMRYTEARMASITEEMLQDIEKDTVDFVPNYDGERVEPTVLPSAVPNLMVNGSSGIAVGMATNIPPHNLREIIDGLMVLLDNEDAAIDDLLKHILAPDFPTGGSIYGMDGVLKAYKTGKGLVKVRANTEVETDEKSGKSRIIITEIPYQVNKSTLVEKIANLVKTKKIMGITNIRDESDRHGMRVVLELRKGEVVPVILNQLYKHTQMQITFGIIMIALVKNRPKQLNLKQLLEEFLNHRRDVIVRRTKFDLKKAENRAHILEGLRIALENIDAIIQLIKAAPNQGEAQVQLMERFNLTEIQSRAILDMRLHRLTGLERQKIQDEYLELIKKINQLRAILGSEQLLKEEIRKELLEIKDKYGDDRRTKIIETVEDIDIEDLVKEEDVAVFVTHSGYTKRNSLSLYRTQKRRGHGITGINAKEGDFVKHLFIASTHDYLLIFTNKGKIYWIKVYNIPDMGRTSRGQALVNLIKVQNNEKVAAIISVRDFPENKYLMMSTKKGFIKKIRMDAFKNPRSVGIKAINLENDELIGVSVSDNNEDVFLATRLGKAIRFRIDSIRPIGRTARGVIGIRLAENDYVVGMDVVDESSTILTFTENGYGKRTDVKEYRLQNRGGKGLINIKINKKTGAVVGVMQVIDNDEILMITNEGKMIRLKISRKSMRSIGRSTQGVKLQVISPSDTIVAVARLAREDNNA